MIRGKTPLLIHLEEDEELIRRGLRLELRLVPETQGRQQAHCILDLLQDLRGIL